MISFLAEELIYTHIKMIKVYTWDEYGKACDDKTITDITFVTARNYQLIEIMKDKQHLGCEWTSGKITIEKKK